MSEIETDPVTEPVVVGLNVTLIVQLAPAASEFPQVLVWANREPTEIPEMLRATVPKFVIVAVCGELFVFTGTVPKLKLVGDRVTFPPVPDNGTD